MGHKVNAKTKKEKIVEEHGKPLGVLLPELYAELGSLDRVAKRLKVTQSTVTYWMLGERLAIVSRMEKVTTTAQERREALSHG